MNEYKSDRQRLMYAFFALPVDVAVKVCRDARVPIEPGDRGPKWRHAAYRYMKDVGRLDDLWDSVVRFQDEANLSAFMILAEREDGSYPMAKTQSQTTKNPPATQ